MKKIFIPLLTAVMVVSIILAGCVPGAAPAPPVTPPPVTPPPVTPPPVVPPEVPELPFNPFEGLGVKPDGTPYKFGLIVQHASDAWYAISVPWSESIHKRAGSEFTLYDSEGDLPKQLAQIEDVLVSRLDGLILIPMGTTETNPVCGELAAAGIPICTWDNTVYEAEGVMSRHVVHHCSPDMVDLGNTDGQYVLDYWSAKGEKGIVFEVWGAPWHVVAKLRHQGFHEIVDPHPDIIEVIESAPGDWTNAWSLPTVEDALAAHPEINTIFEHSDVYSRGVIEAMRVSNRLFPRDDPQHIFFVSIDAGVQAYGYIKDGYMDCSAEISNYKMPLTPWKVLFTYVCLGQPISEYREVTIPTYLMTPENINTGLYGVIWRDYPGEYDYWPIYDYLVPTPTRLDPATVPANPMPGEEHLAPSPRLVTPTGDYD